MTSTPWTDDRVVRLTQLWTEGLSASEIAADLGGVTRNAVLGKLYRLGLLGGRSKTAATKPPRPQTRRRTRVHCRPPRASPPVRASRQPAPDWPGEVARVEGLGPHHCRWPIGDPLTPGFSFCGRRADSGPYCLAHRRVAYVGRVAA